MWCHETNHFPAVIETSTGHRNRFLEHPCLGSWVDHALGRATENLPAFVNLGRPTSPVQVSGGFLGSSVSATPLMTGDEPIRNLRAQAGVSAAERDRRMELLEKLNREFREQYATESSIRGRLKAYELAARMQLTAPEAVDFSGESEAVKRLYGIGTKETDDFGKQLLLARRLVERGVGSSRSAMPGAATARGTRTTTWRAHAPLCRQTDQPIAGLIRDLKQRGMLENTLVVWTSEFGRTPWSQNTTGRDHNGKGYSTWLAGAGVRGGTVYGATDDVGYRAVENPVYIADLQATILHLLGYPISKMEVTINGRPVRLVPEGGSAKPVYGILA